MNMKHLEKNCKILKEILENNLELAEISIKTGEPVDAQNEYGVCALHVAAKQNLYQIAKMLLEYHANPNLRNDSNEIPMESLKEDETPYVPNNLTSETFEELQEMVNVTALHIAVNEKNFDIVALLLKYGADPNIADWGGSTPLHWAAIIGDVSLLKILIEKGAKVNSQDLSGSTPLHEAIRHQNKMTIQVLLENFADPNIKDITNHTPFELAKFSTILTELIMLHSKIIPAGIAKC